MSQEELFDAAKQGNPQAIASIINRSLQPKGITAKASCLNSCLTIVVEAENAPQQEAVVSFLKSGIHKLKPENVAKVTIRGRSAGQVKTVWQDSFELENSAATDKPSTAIKTIATAAKPVSSITRIHTQTSTSNKLSAKALIVSKDLTATLKNFVKTRNGERVAIGVSTFLVTSLLWFSVGLLKTVSSDQPIANGSNPGNPWMPQIPALSSGGQVPTTYSLSGTFTLIDSDLGGTIDYCYGRGGYSDIQAGMPVTIRDGSGNILAIGSTGAGSHPTGSSYSTVKCVFPFQVDNIPQSAFYSIEIGRRGALNYSFEDLQNINWEVAFSL